MENSTQNMQKVQLFRTILEDKGAPIACKGNCEEQNSLEAHMNFIENLVVKVSSDIISLMSIVKENSDTLKMLNANVNRVMKRVVDNETTKSNNNMTDKCAKTYITHPSKSSEKKELPMKFEDADEMIVAEHNFSKEDMRSANELTNSIGVVYIPMNDRVVHWFLIVVHLQCRRVAFLNSLPSNKSNDFRRESAKDLVYIPFKDGKVH
ncbi:hypothetical protein Cgig2_024878 [Carnegiea gigantea]|uniref:Ubiquitin-like protease family profile domain-containing protein n=1 Tax=Carnegiea gigantea TaxID=171969 RepID=A0A9Q1H0F7_9CARY|nr:hypothetical protein Cgig2_024878 [Carnegiea gigantea]